MCALRRRFPSPNPPLECGHGGAACQTCVLRFAGDELDRHGDWDRLSCIECNGVMGRIGVESMLSRKEVQMWVLSSRNAHAYLVQ